MNRCGRGLYYKARAGTVVCGQVRTTVSSTSSLIGLKKAVISLARMSYTKMLIVIRVARLHYEKDLFPPLPV